MPAPLPYHADMLRRSIGFNGATNFIEVMVSLSSLDADAKTFLGDVQQALGLWRNLANAKRDTRIPTIALVSQANIDSHDITRLQNSFIWQSVADFVVDRGANHARKRWMFGGITPVMTSQLVIESPEPVRRVIPPRITWPINRTRPRISQPRMVLLYRYFFFTEIALLRSYFHSRVSIIRTTSFSICRTAGRMES